MNSYKEGEIEEMKLKLISFLFIFIFFFSNLSSSYIGHANVAPSQRAIKGFDLRPKAIGKKKGKRWEL